MRSFGERVARSGTGAGPDDSETECEQHHTGNDSHSVQQSFLDHVRYSRGRNAETSTPHARFLALALMVRDRLANRWLPPQPRYHEPDVKRAAYLSAEYLLGRTLGSTPIALDPLEHAPSS